MRRRRWQAFVAVPLGAAVGASCLAGFFWIGGDYEARPLLVLAWAIMGGITGAVIAAMVCLLD